MQNLCSVHKGRQMQRWDRTMDCLCGHVNVRPQAVKSHRQTFRFLCETTDTTEIALLTPCSWARARIALAQLGAERQTCRTARGEQLVAILRIRFMGAHLRRAPAPAIRAPSACQGL